MAQDSCPMWFGLLDIGVFYFKIRYLLKRISFILGVNRFETAYNFTLEDVGRAAVVWLYITTRQVAGS